MKPRAGRHARARTRLDPTVRRASILDAAELVFDGRNPAEVTFEEIADAASVSRGLVYNYFGDKGGLVAALYRRTFDRLDQAILDRLDGHDSDGEAALRAVVGAYLCFARDNQSAWRLISTAEAAAHPEVQSARQERFRRMAAAWGGSDQALVLAAGIVGFLEASTLAWLDSPATAHRRRHRPHGADDLGWGGQPRRHQPAVAAAHHVRQLDVRAPRRGPRRRPLTRAAGLPAGRRRAVRWSCRRRASSTRPPRCATGGRDHPAARARRASDDRGGPMPWRNRCARRGLRWATRRAGAG